MIVLSQSARIERLQQAAVGIDPLKKLRRKMHRDTTVRFVRFDQQLMGLGGTHEEYIAGGQKVM